MKNELRLVLLEANFNYHVGKLDLDNLEPYYSDNIGRMSGRGTGHFGSGMYFSTYNCYSDRADYDDKYGEYGSELGRRGNDNPNLIQMDKKVYRIDFDLYKNLYRVTSNKHGKFLFKTMSMMNNLMYSYTGKRGDDFKKNYLVIQNNLKYLKLKLPPYKELIQIINDSVSDYKNSIEGKNVSNYATFPTRIMEYNGYNGVNVSNIPDFDNTTHGSVIYDINKVNTEMKQVNPDLLSCDIENDVISDYKDILAYVLKHGELKLIDLDNLNKLNSNELNKIFNQLNELIGSSIEKLKTSIQIQYVRILPKILRKNKFKKEISGEEITMMVYYHKHYVLYENIKMGSYETILAYILDSMCFDRSLNSSIKKMLLRDINRELTEEEKEYYEDFKNFID